MVLDARAWSLVGESVDESVSKHINPTATDRRDYPFVHSRGSALVGIWRYGSIYATSLALSGYCLAPSPAKVSVPSIDVGEPTQLVFTVRNLTSEDVTVVGSRSSCRCTRLKDLPMTIAARGTAKLTAAVTAAESDVGESLSGRILLYVDVPSPPINLYFSVGEVLSTADLARAPRHELESPGGP